MLYEVITDDIGLFHVGATDTPDRFLNGTADVRLLERRKAPVRSPFSIRSIIRTFIKAMVVTNLLNIQTVF